MKAQLLLIERHQLRADAFVELRIWLRPIGPRVGPSVQICAGLCGPGDCVLRYDNEAGKGDHRHVGDVETAYRFTTPDQLLADFWRDVDQWRPG